MKFRTVVGLFLVALGVIAAATFETRAPATPATAAVPDTPEAKAARTAAAKRDADEQAARAAKFAIDRPALVVQIKRLNRAAKYEDARTLATQHSWAADPDLTRELEFARTKIAEQADRQAKAQKRKEGVSLGMTVDDVLASSWGKPEHVNRTTTAGGTREQWVYPGHHSYLYFTDGVLTTIQN